MQATALQASARQEHCNTLRRQIERLKDVQSVYMPGVSQLRDSRATHITPHAYTIISQGSGAANKSNTKHMSAARDNELPELICLWLPSDIPHQSRDAVCTSGLAAKEAQLWIAQADDALVELHCQLRILVTLRDFKCITIGGTSQGLSTKTHHVMQCFARKMDRCAAHYRAAYSALVQLDPDGDWKSQLRVMS